MYKTSSKKIQWHRTIKANNTVGHSSNDPSFYMKPPPFKEAKPILRKGSNIETDLQLPDGQGNSKRKTNNGRKQKSSKSTKEPFNGLFSVEILTVLKDIIK